MEKKIGENPKHRGCVATMILPAECRLLETVDLKSRCVISNFFTSKGSALVVEGPPGAGKSTTVKDLSKNTDGDVLYMTLNTALVDESTKVYSSCDNVTCCTLDAINHAALKIIMKGGFELADTTLLENKSEQARIDAWVSTMPVREMGSQGPHSSTDNFATLDAICNGNARKQKIYLTWKVLRYIVFKTKILGRIASGRLRQAERDYINTEDDTVRRKVQALVRSKVVIIDEAQDFDTFITAAILLFVAPYKKVLWLGDSGQSIYQEGSWNIFSISSSEHECYSSIFTDLSSKYGVDIMSLRFDRTRLRKSFRVPLMLAEVLRFMGSGRFTGNPKLTEIKLVPSKDENFRLISKRSPYLFYKNASMFRWALDEIAKSDPLSFQIANFEAKKENIIEVVTNYERTVRASYATNTNGSKARKITKKTPYPNSLRELFGQDASKDQIVDKLDALERRMGDFLDPTFIIGTIHSFKGAEFPVWRISDDVWDLKNYHGGDTEKRRKNLLNVALSRGAVKMVVDGDAGVELATLYNFRGLPRKIKSIIVGFSPWLMSVQ